MEVLAYKPSAFWKLDDPSPFVDYSGYNRSASASGTEQRGLPLTSNATYCQVFDSTHIGTFTSNVYRPGQNNKGFTIGASVRVIAGDDTAEQQILSSQNQTDGLTVSNGVISFGTRYSNTGEAKCSYDIKTLRKVNLVGIHSLSKNSLYVNGELVSEVDITPEQQEDVYASTSSLYSGKTTTTQKIAINDVFMFAQPLSSDIVKRLNNFSNDKVIGSVSRQYGGQDILLSSESRYPFINTTWSTEEDWKSASLFDVVVEQNRLLATTSNGLTNAGEWMDGVDLYTGGSAVPVDSVNLWWDGVNVSVQASLDSVTWTPVTKGKNISIIPVGFDPTDKVLSIKVSFEAGNTEAYIENMQIKAYNSPSAIINNRVVEYKTSVVPRVEKDPFEYHDDWGVKISPTGALIIHPDLITDTQQEVKTIEVWYKSVETTQEVSIVDLRSTSNTNKPYFNTSNNTVLFGNATVYVDGVAKSSGSTKPIAGQWHVVHLVSPTNLSGDTIKINSTPSETPANLTSLEVGKVVVYDKTLTATDITNLIASYTGFRISRTSSGGGVSLAELPDSALIYAYDWSIESS